MSGDLKDQLVGLQSHLNKFVNRINGDDWTPSLTSGITNTLNAIDKNSESQKINPVHFDKLIIYTKEAVGTMTKLSEYISHLNIRYTSKDANVNLLNDILNNFTMKVNTIQIEETKPKEDTRNGAELIKDGVI